MLGDRRLALVNVNSPREPRGPVWTRVRGKPRESR